VFFAGGNQTKYFDVFHDTRVADAINRLVNEREGVIGGTSAGMHAIGTPIHTPRGSGNSVLSTDSLMDPYLLDAEKKGSASVTFSEGLFDLPGMHGVITDTHWSERDRLGRSLVFLARALADGTRRLGELSLIAADEGTAVVVDQAGIARVYGKGSAFFFQARRSTRDGRTRSALEWRSGVPMVEVRGSDQGDALFDTKKWVSPNAPTRRVKVIAGTVHIDGANP
jgi:cyanophycinase-like exopeptidase